MLAVAAIVPLLGLSIVKAVLSNNTAVSRVTRNLEFAASVVAANQQRVADSARQTLTAISSMPDLLAGRNCAPFLTRLIEQLPMYSNVGVVGVNGFIRCHSLDSSGTAFVGDREYFQAAMAQRTFVTGGYLQARPSGMPIITFAQPVFGADGKVVAVVFAAMRLAEVAKEVNLARLPQESRMLLIDRAGIVLAANPDTGAVVGRPVSDAVIQQAVKAGDEGVFEGEDAPGAKRIYAFVPSSKALGQSFFVAVSIARSEVLAPARLQLLLDFLALTLVTFFGGWIAWMMGGRAIVMPTARILNAAGQLKAGRMDVRIAPDSGGQHSEFSRIADGINSMADSLQQRESDLAIELTHSRQALAALKQLQATQTASYTELGNAQRKLLDAQRLGRIGHWELDLETGQLSVSDDLPELFGLERGALLGSQDDFAKMVHPEDSAQYTHLRELAQLEGRELDIEYRIVTPSGDVRWMHQRGKSRFNNAGVADSRTGVVQDITSRKQAELAVTRSTEQLRRTGEMAQIGGWEISLEPLTAEWSEECYRIHELDPDDRLDPMQALTFYAPEVQPTIRQAVRAAIEAGVPWDMELPLITAKGRPIWVRTQGQAVKHNGKVIGLVGALQDITVQHASQQQLRLLETCIAHLNDMVLITEAEPVDDPGPRIVYVNEAFERHTGYTRQEVLGKTPRLFQGPNSQRAELDRIRVALKARQPVRVELINYTKEGKEFWAEIDIVPVADATGWYTHWVAVQRDITARKLAEQALVHSEQRYAALFESAPVPMWIVDAESHAFVAINDAGIKRYGYLREEFLRMTIFDICPDLEARRLQAEIRAGTRPPVNRRVHRHKDGAEFHVETVARTVQYGGRPSRFVVALDITAQVRAEKDVQDHLFMLQRAVDAAQAITWHHTLDGMLHEVAEQARGVIGAHQAVVSFNPDMALAQSIVALSLSSKYAAYRQQGGPPPEGLIYSIAGDGKHALKMTQTELEAHPRWHAFVDHAGEQPPMRGCLAVPLLGRSGENIGLLQLSDKYEGDFTQYDEYVLVEIAQFAAIAIENAQLLEQVSELNTGLEQKVAERTLALARQESLFRALADQAPQVVWTADPDGRPSYFNRAWFDLVGGVLKDWTGNAWTAAIHPDDLSGVLENWHVATTTNLPFVGIRRLVARDGSHHTMSYRASPVAGANGEVAFWVGIDADITEIKNSEAALRLSNQELEAFSYSVSHDLRSPLNTIDGFSRLLAKQLTGEVGPKGQHYISRIQAGVAQMGKLIEDLLSLAQVSRMQLHYEFIDLSALSKDILDEWQGRQPDRQVVCDIESGLQAIGDSRLIPVLLENLLGNAWKFTSQTAGARIQVRKRLGADGQPVFVVSDNGVGFDMAYVDKLFVAFQRLHSAAEFPGTGIGLATASRVIARHGGRLWPEAAPGAGAAFFFTLPNTGGVLQISGPKDEVSG